MICINCRVLDIRNCLGFMIFFQKFRVKSLGFMRFSRDTLILEKLNSDAVQVCYLCFAEY